MLDAIGDRNGQAAAWDGLGYAQRRLGQSHTAIACYQHAIELCRELGDRYTEATTLAHLGEAHQAAGQPEAAGSTWQHALDILDELDHPDADQLRTQRHSLHPPARPTPTRAASPGSHRAEPS
jgi:tetratricopeptide (TPR) repeat protein